jgi:hypothetical protein
VRAVWIADDLDKTFAIAQVDENHSAMIATAVDPTAQLHGQIEFLDGHQTAIVGTHCYSSLDFMFVTPHRAAGWARGFSALE